MEYVNKDSVYHYFEEAYQVQPERKLRNNIRMLCMALRYSDLYIIGGNVAELKYMYNHLDSYTYHPEYGLSVFIPKDRHKEKEDFVPNKWYKMYKKNKK